jgi:hypothetical protein
MKNILLAAILSGMVAFPLAGSAVDDSVTPVSKTVESTKPETGYEKPMKPDEAMPTGMAKPGMKKGDVKNSAEKKQTEMEKMMREEMK